MRTAPLAILALTLGATLLAGCLGEATSPVRVEAYVELVDASANRTVQAAFYMLSTDSFRQTLPIGIDGLPPGWTFEPAIPEVVLDGKAGGSLVVNVTPGPDAQLRSHTLRLKVGETRADLIVNVEERADEVATPNASVDLEYVAFATNGSVLSTNRAALRNSTFIPNATRALPGIEANATSPLRAHLADGAGPDAPIALPSAWRDAILRGPDGSGARAGDVLVVGMDIDGAAATVLLRVLDVTPPHDG